MNENAKISIIIPIYNALESVKDCLKSLKTNIVFTQTEILLIDDCSNEATKNFLKNFCSQNKKFHLITNNKNLGFIKTCNKGLQFTKADIYVLLNSDTIIPEKFEEKIINCFLSNKTIGLSSPITSAGACCCINFNKKLSLNEINALLDKKHKPRYYKLLNAEGFCFCIKQEVLNSIGYFDEKYGFGYNEEVDYSYRATSAGWECVLIDNLYVFHRDHQSFGKNKRKMLLEENNKIFNEKWKDYKIKYQKTHNIFNPIPQIMIELFLQYKIYFCLKHFIYKFILKDKNKQLKYTVIK